MAHGALTVHTSDNTVNNMGDGHRRERSAVPAQYRGAGLRWKEVISMQAMVFSFFFFSS